MLAFVEALKSQGATSVAFGPVAVTFAPPAPAERSNGIPDGMDADEFEKLTGAARIAMAERLLYHSTGGGN